jgi:hypothetical protein
VQTNIENITFEEEIWMPIKVNEERQHSDGWYLASWLVQNNRKIQGGASMTQ